LGMNTKLSIALSLAIVGATSLIGVISHYRSGNVNIKIAFAFAPVAMVGTFIGAKLSQFISGEAQLTLFGITMLMAAIFMFRGRGAVKSSQAKKSYVLIFIVAIVVGILTGIVGVGGGFLIVPALVLLAGASMKESVGTSLLIISLNSFSGFVGYIGVVDIPWTFLLQFTLFSVGGVLIGASLVKFLSQELMKKGFAIFLIVMGFFILYKNRAIFISSYSASIFQ